MKLSKLTVILGGCVLILIGIISGKILLLIYDIDDSVSYAKRYPPVNHKYIGNEFKNVGWMLQISDLHISIFQDPKRISELAHFCNHTIDVIKPSVVLASGDLTNAFARNGTSTQYEEEWRIYNDILIQSNVANKTLWLDIRGNHDNSDVKDINSDNNYFRKYSIQGHDHPRSYFYTIELNNGEKVGFIAVDLCPIVGVKLAFNFGGRLTDDEMKTVKSLLQRARDLDVKYLFWFGHYPTSTIHYPGSKELRELIASEDRTTAYLCGHFHKLGGLVSNLYTYQKEGFFELELGDWKSNRVVRIMAIDHGQFSFVDVTHGTWPIVLVTNPKTALVVPPLKNVFIPYSTHIRLLVFSPFSITNVKLKIDGGEWKQCSPAGGPLYVAEWNERSYKEGLHIITVEAEDDHHNKVQIEHSFSLDGSRLKNKVLPRFFLMPDLGMTSFYIFSCAVICCALPLIVFRYITKYAGVDAEQISSFKCRCVMLLCRRFCIISQFDRFFYPLAIYPIYLFFGPWAVFFVVGKTLGVVFAWGIIVDFKYEPSWILYVYGWKQLIWHLFLIFHLAGEIDRKCYDALRKHSLSSKRHAIWKYIGFIWDHIFYVIVILLQLMEVYFISHVFGLLTLTFCPLTWWLIMALWLKIRVMRLDSDELLYMGRQWCSLS